MSAALFSLAGQTALVTGGTRGIGQAVAVALADAGADVLLVQRDTANTATQQAIEARGRHARIYAADLADQAQVAGLVPRIVADGYRVHVLVNCAGIQRRHASEAFPDDDFDEVTFSFFFPYSGLVQRSLKTQQAVRGVLQVNLRSVFTLSRDVGAHMLASADVPAVLGRRGSIVNFASLLAFQGGLTVPAYAAAKGGVMQLTKSLANEWAARGIAVNAIAPGYVATEMNAALLADAERLAAISARIPAGRWGAPEDFAGAAVFLASRAAAYVSGHTLVVDGGWMGR